jgi:hypothetical protein
MSFGVRQVFQSFSAEVLERVGEREERRYCSSILAFSPLIVGDSESVAFDGGPRLSPG